MEDYKRCIESMPNRIRALILTRGDAIKYWSFDLLTRSVFHQIRKFQIIKFNVAFRGWFERESNEGEFGGHGPLYVKFLTPIVHTWCADTETPREKYYPIQRPSSLTILKKRKRERKLEIWQFFFFLSVSFSALLLFFSLCVYIVWICMCLFKSQVRLYMIVNHDQRIFVFHLF